MFKKLIKEMESMRKMQLSVPIETDEEGYFDKECPSDVCLFPFKIHNEDWKGKNEQMFCPMCGHEAKGDDFWTTEQSEHIEKLAVNHIEGLIGKALKAGADDFNRNHSHKGFITMKMKYRGDIHSSVILPIPATKELEQKITCSECNTRYCVLGSAFFCPVCGHNSASVTFDNSIKKIEIKIASIETIRKAVSEISADDAEITVRSLIESGLSDAVVAFQRFCEVTYSNCKKDDKKIKPNAFQNLEAGEELWKSLFGEGYSDWINPHEMEKLNILFQKRHLLAHSEGIVDEKYIGKSGDMKYKPGQRIVVNKDDVLSMVCLIKKIVENIRKKLNTEL